MFLEKQSRNPHNLVRVSVWKKVVIRDMVRK